jgi:hypothetical protein
MKIKYSQKLNRLAAKLADIIGDSDSIVRMKLHSEAFIVCTEDSNDYRSVDYAEYFEAGFQAALKCLNSKKSIYCVLDPKDDTIYYFLGDVNSLSEMYNKFIEEAEEELLQAGDAEIANLEQKLAKLKKNKAKKKVK